MRALIWKSNKEERIENVRKDANLQMRTSMCTKNTKLYLFWYEYRNITEFMNMIKKVNNNEYFLEMRS